MTAIMSKAISFLSPLGYREIQAKLNSSSPWKWTGHDSDYYGDYLLTRPTAAFGTRIRLFCDSKRYVFDLEFDDESLADGLTAEKMAEIVEQQLLPMLGATDITPTGTYG